MDRRSIFHLIHDLTHKEGVPCVLIGGFAVNHYNVSRQTADVDFLITKENFDRLTVFFEKAGYKQTLTHENFIQLKSSQLSFMDIDFMFVDEETLTKIINEGESLKIADQEFIVPSLYHLIALKMHSIKYNSKNRFTRDFPDIINLIKMNNVDINDKEFKNLCLKYGTEDLYAKIWENLK